MTAPQFWYFSVSGNRDLDPVSKKKENKYNEFNEVVFFSLSWDRPGKWTEFTPQDPLVTWDEISTHVFHHWLWDSCSDFPDSQGWSHHVCILVIKDTERAHEDEATLCLRTQSWSCTYFFCSYPVNQNLVTWP